MQISVSGKQIDVGDALRGHIEDRLAEVVEKYFDHAIDGNVVISRNAHNLRSDISVHVGRGILVQGHAESENAYTAFDLAADRIAKRLRRHKRRLRDHRSSHADPLPQPTPAQQYILADTVDEDDDSTAAGGQPVVIAEMTTGIDTLTVGEAVMRMDLADQATLLFVNAAHGGLNVVYRRPDGNIGWIDPQGNPTGQGNG